MPFQRRKSAPTSHVELDDQHEVLQEPARSMYGLTYITEAKHRAYHESRGESADHSHDKPEDEHVYNDTDDEWLEPTDEDDE